MGGIGSGSNWDLFAKLTTEDYPQIDIRCWKRDGLLSLNRSFSVEWSQNGEKTASINVCTQSGKVILSYRHKSNGDEWEDKSYPIYIDTTPCYMGGVRHWFLCPAQGCNRRVAILYGGRIFACRYCHQIGYPSQREDSSIRAARRADRIRDKLNGEAVFIDGIGRKPKGMHWRTFERLAAEYEVFSQKSLMAFMDKNGKLIC